jgi:hypothetical protein
MAVLYPLMGIGLFTLLLLAQSVKFLPHSAPYAMPQTVRTVLLYHFQVAILNVG